MYTSTLIKKAARLLEKKANQLLKPYQITHGYTYFLMALFEQEGLTQTQLQQSIGVEQPTVVRTLDRMERDGLIMRQSSATDRRVFHIYLTDKGRACEPMVNNAALELNQALFQAISAEEEVMIKAYLQRLIDNLEDEKDA